MQITARGLSLHGEFKTKARAIVATAYGFEMGEGTTTREKNQNLVLELKSKSAFTYCMSTWINHGDITN